MPSSELHFLEIKTRVKYGVSPLGWALLKLRERTNYGKCSTSLLIFTSNNKIFVLGSGLRSIITCNFMFSLNKS